MSAGYRKQQLLNPTLLKKVSTTATTTTTEWTPQWSTDTFIHPSVLVFFVIHIIAIAASFHSYWLKTLSWSSILLAGVSFTLRMFFIAGFYHRYFSHRSYKTSRWGQFIFGILGCTTLQKGPLWWSSQHRHHHKYADTERDYHTPVRFGFIWSHCGWFLFSHQYNNINSKYIPDWLLYPELIWLEKLHILPWLLMLIICYAFAGLEGALWGVIIPQVPLWHFTYFINSSAHIWGTERFWNEHTNGDNTRNNGWLALWTLGEGWHNNHYADTRSAQQGLLWYEFDLTFRILCLLNALGIIWSMKPSKLYDNKKQNFYQNLSSSPVTATDNTTVTKATISSKSIGKLIKYPHNAIYEGVVVHTRYQPIVKHFSYKLYMMYIELDDKTIDSAFDNYWFWSSRDKDFRTLPAVASFRASEYLSKQKIQEMVQEEWKKYLASHNSQCMENHTKSNKTINYLCISRVCLLTHFRYFGFKFNPVSYYYCFNQEDKLVAMVSEIHNTPWSEVCWYVHLTLKIAEGEIEKNQKLCYHPLISKSSDSNIPDSNYYWTGDKPKYIDWKTKKMHISPFFDMSYTYRVKFDSPDEFLNVSWEMFSTRKNSKGHRDFYAMMRLRRVHISQSSLNKVLLQYPFMTAKVILSIYYQAGMLYFSKVPFITHPSKRKRGVEDEEKDFTR